MDAPLFPLRPSNLPLVDPDFEDRLVTAIEPIRQYFLAACINHLFSSGIHAFLVSRGRVAVPNLAEELNLDQTRAFGLLHFLANEDIIDADGSGVDLTERGRGLAEFKSWYQFLIGGYGGTVREIGAALTPGSPACTRDGESVGIGSCEIAEYDGLAMVRDLLDHSGRKFGRILDLGCGSGLYLFELLRSLDGAVGWGVEPDAGGITAARRSLASAGLDGRITLINEGAIEFLANPHSEIEPDLVVFGYVLQEILGQDGDEALAKLLRGVRETYPNAQVAVVEVVASIDNPDVMAHPLAKAFWNPYFLMHYVTNQRLESREYWEDLFRRCGYDVTDAVSPAQFVDSSGIELAYLLRSR